MTCVPKIKDKLWIIQCQILKLNHVIVLRKRNSWFEGMEHPSAFSSFLRATTPTSTQTPASSTRANSVSRKDSFGSTTLTRKDSSGSTSLDRRNSGVAFGRKESSSGFKLNGNKRDSFHEDFRRLSFGNSIYLRPNSSGETTLVRRDSFAPSTRPNKVSSRDYVSLANLNGPKPDSSILRKDSFADKENDGAKLTTANLTKHVTILENENRHSLERRDSTNEEKIADYIATRRDSDGSLTNYLNNRRISVDSLDARRSSVDRSRRGSTTSGDFKFNEDDENEVCVLFIYFFWFYCLRSLY